MSYLIPEQKAVNFFLTKLEKKNGFIHSKSLFKDFLKSDKHSVDYFREYTPMDRISFFTYFPDWFDMTVDGYVTIAPRKSSNPQYTILEQGIVDFFVSGLEDGSYLPYETLIQDFEDSNSRYNDYFIQKSSAERLEFFKELTSCFIVTDDGLVALASSESGRKLESVDEDMEESSDHQVVANPARLENYSGRSSSLLDQVAMILKESSSQRSILVEFLKMMDGIPKLGQNIFQVSIYARNPDDLPSLESHDVEYRIVPTGSESACVNYQFQ